MDADEKQRGWDERAREELWRLVNGQGPSDVPAKAFGPWTRYIYPLRATHERDVDKVRDLLVWLARKHTELAGLCATDGDACHGGTSLNELLPVELRKPRWVVPDILPAGLVTLAGRKHAGKTTLALQIALAVSTGGQVLARPAARGRVLYLALEDNGRRLEQFLRAQGAPEGGEIYFHHYWPALMDGGLDDFYQAIWRDGYTLVILDSMHRLLDDNAPEHEAAGRWVAGELRELTAQTGATVLVVRHVVPGGRWNTMSKDPFTRARGKDRWVDAAMELYRRGDEERAWLKGKGHNVAELDLPLAWHGPHDGWQVALGSEAACREPAELAVVEAIRGLTARGEVACLTSLCAWLGKDRSQVYSVVLKLCARGAVLKGEKRGKMVPYRVIDVTDHLYR